MIPRSLPFTIYPNKSKIIRLLFISCAFVGGGVLMICDRQMMGWLAVVFFGLGVPIFIIQLFPNSSFLTVSDEGIEFCSLFRKSKLKWSDIAEFGVFSIRNHGLTVRKIIGINFSATYTLASKGRAVAKALSGFEGALPDTYGLQAEELVELLSMYHFERAAKKNF
jgi:hypothetical protein